MTTATFAIRQTLTVQTRVTSAPGILAYRCQLEDEDAPTTSWEGLCGALDTPTRSNWRPKTQERWVLLHVLSIEALAKWGWGGERNDFSELGAVSSTPFSDISNSDYRLVRLDPDSEMLFDDDGAPFVVAKHVWSYHWDFASGRMKDVVEHLGEHPHVTDLQVDADPDAHFSKVRPSDVRYVWTPDLETYRRAWARCLKLEGPYPSAHFSKAIRDLDLLGLVEIGCAK